METADVHLSYGFLFSYVGILRTIHDIISGSFGRGGTADYQYPLYDEKISNYVIRQKAKYGVDDNDAAKRERG